MSETTNLKLKKHDNPETNTEKFDIENYLNGNWDKIDKNVGEVNTDILNINSKNKEQDTNIEQLQENTETSSNKIAKLEKELKEAQEDFYQNSIRGQANGEYIHVEDSSNCRAKIGISGNSEQETREGYNLLDLTSLIGKTETKNGVTYKINEDCSITVNGTPTDYTSFILLDMSLKAGTYKFVDELDNINNVFLQTIGNFQHTSQNNTFSLAEDGKATVYLVIPVGAPTLNNATLYPMIYEGTEDKPYEQYGAMPSPDYRSKVVAVGSNVNLLENTLKSQIINGIDVKVQDNGEIVLNGTATDNFFLVIGKINKIKNMTFSGMCDGYGYNKMILQIQGKDYNVNVVNSNQITLSDLDTEATVRLYIYKGTSVINAIIEPKIVEGTEAGEYSKFGQGCVKTTKCNKNIMPILNLENNYEYIENGIRSLKRNDGVKVTRFNVKKGQTIKFGLKLFSRPTQGTSWTIYFENTGIASFAHLENSSSFDLNKVYEKTYTASTDGEIFIKLWGNSNSDVFEFQLWAELDNLTEYEQHEEQSYIMPVQKEMLEGDYVADVEHHEWKKLTLTGNENIKLNTAFANVFNIEIPKINIMNQQVCLCNIAKGVVYNTALLTIQDNIIMTASLNKIVYKSTKFSSLSEFKTYLQNQYEEGTPVIVYYKLAEPINLELTDEQKAVAKELNNARTYKNVTNITTDSKAILSLDYVKDQETQNNKMLNEIDEIKQLLSTTQTSALLLDNMQTDIESEVK